MTDHIRSRRAPLLVAATTLTLAACGGAGGDTRAAADSAQPALADTALAPVTAPVDSVAPVAADSPAVAPAETAPAPVAAAPAAPARPAPAKPKATAPTRAAAGNGGATAAAPAPAEKRGTIGSGTTLRLSLGEKVCSGTLNEGERVSATLVGEVDGSNGARIPGGSRVSLVVTRSTQTRNNEVPELAFRAASVRIGERSYDLDGRVTIDSLALEREGGDAKKVAIGAAAGAVIGNIVGGGNRAVRTAAGAAAGGLAGAATAAATGKRNACVPAGRYLSVRTTAPLSIVVE
jgi:hypothetical protein